MSDAGVTHEPDTAALYDAWSRRPGVTGWLGQCNHKAVGLRFMVTAMVTFLVAGAMALTMRAQLATPEASVTTPDLYNQLFTLHGTLMMFFFAVPMVEGMIIYFVPLQLGARDMPMPRLSAFGYWLYLAGAVILLGGFLVGAGSDGGWYAYPPLTSAAFSPGAGVDVWLLSVTLTEVSAIVASIEIVVLVLRARAPGMTLARMPLFAWAALATAAMILVAFPPLVVTSLLLELERKIGMPFFDPTAGGDPFLWQHLFWWFGHPEVYIQLLPGLGILATVLPAATRRRMPMRWLVVASFLAIAIVSFGLWVHHMFTVGIPQVALQFFSAASNMITIPSGIIVFAFVATLWTGRVVRWDTATLFALGFLVVFVFGGITGVMVAVVSFNWQAHDTYFIVGHFHSVLIGGVVFPIFAGLYHWFPRAVGRRVSTRAGAWSFGLMLAGFLLTFVPQHVVGLLGMTRRTWTYDASLDWGGWNLASSIGSAVLGIGVLVSVGAFVVAWRRGRSAGTDPWDAPTLEWGIAAPPPPMNFVSIPVVDDAHPRWSGAPRPSPLETTPWYRRLAAPHDPNRTILLTSAVHGRPEALLVVPGHSLAPLGATVAITAGLLGVLADSAVTGALAVAALIAFLVAWTWPARHDATPPIGRTDPIEGDSRTIGWWGAALGLVVVAHVVAAALVAAWYLRAGSATWPPAGVETALPWASMFAAALAALLAAGAAVVGARRVRMGDTGIPRILFATAGTGAAAGAVIRTWGAVASGLPTSEHAFHAIWWLVVALDVGLLAIAAAVTLLAVVHVGRQLVTPQRHAVADVAGLWTAATSAAVVLDVVVLTALTRWWT